MQPLPSPLFIGGVTITILCGLYILGFIMYATLVSLRSDSSFPQVTRY